MVRFGAMPCCIYLPTYSASIAWKKGKYVCKQYSGMIAIQATIPSLRWCPLQQSLAAQLETVSGDRECGRDHGLHLPCDRS